MSNFKYIFLSGIIISIGLFSCKTNQISKGNDSFNFSISGKVDNGDGVTLFLYQPSQGLDNRLKSTIRNGEYLFEGKARLNELAEIRFEENAHQTSMYSSTPILIEKDIVKFDFEIVGDSPLMQTDYHKIINGAQNKFYYTQGKRMQKSITTWVFGDSIKMDSMINFEYPKVRDNSLKLYNEICTKNSPQFPCLLLLENMTDGFNESGPFNKNLLSTLEKFKLRKYFSMIDTSLHETLNYQNVSKSINRLELNSNDIIFKEYILIDSNRDKISLSSVIRNNEITILDFWWSGCGPCRKFNKEYSTKYEKLKAKGIEIIGINVDESMEKWLQSSGKDGIKWINLYGGKNTPILKDYNISYFPTKLLFNSNEELVSIGFKNISELEQLINE